jgi:hypothetical protein
MPELADLGRRDTRPGTSLDPHLGALELFDLQVSADPAVATEKHVCR